MTDDRIPDYGKKVAALSLGSGEAGQAQKACGQ